MPLTRRDFLKLGGLSAAALTAAGCQALGREMLKSDLPDALTLPGGAPLPAATAVAGGPPAAVTAVDPLWRLLNRAGYGPRPGDYAAAAALGYEAYLEWQLAPEGIEDTGVELLVRNLDHYHKDISELISDDEVEVVRDLGQATAMRAVFSRRQLYEAMVEFWSDHFNIFVRKAPIVIPFKVIDDREVIRAHALGSFRYLLFASAQSPAMLAYLDNTRNLKEAPNENYARELMELHTLGVHGGYTQHDVQEVARAFTGWGAQRRRGTFHFEQRAHDTDPKVVLGQTLPGGRGMEDGMDVLEILVNHPSTAGFIATKLVRRFVGDEPPAELVRTVAGAFTATNGDIKSMLRVIFLSDQFKQAPPKLKRPYTYVVSALRALHADVGDWRVLGRGLSQMGQVPFNWPAPDGYPDEAAAWAGNLLPRWNFALALLTGNVRRTSLPLEALAEAGGVQDIDGGLDFFSGLMLGRGLDEATRAMFATYIDGDDVNNPQTRRRLQEVLGLLLASPAFQWT